jgi:HAD superfamily hydrolase (TIGR01509 family)
MMVLFDIGSTLIDGPPCGPARRLAEMLGLDQPAVAQLERLLFRSPSETAEELARHIAAELGVDATAACRELWQAQLTEAYVLPGARETIDRLRQAGVPRGYLSNIWPPFYEQFRREFAGEAGTPQFLSFQTGLMKPDPAFFRYALARLPVRAEDIVMVGDTYRNDILPAIELGMRTVWVLHRPDKERAALVEVLNGRAPKPALTLPSIGALKMEDIL